MAIQAWVSPKTDFELNDVPNVDDLNNIEQDLLHLKQYPNDDFDLIGRLGQGWFASAQTFIMFYVVKRIPPRSSVYIREASKCCPNPDGELRYTALLMQASSVVTYPKNENLTWHTAPDPNPLIRWKGSKPTHTQIEHFYYDDLGLKLMTNSLYVSAYVEFVGYMFSLSSGEFSPEDTLYMRFHIGYDDI